jgi:DNA-binding MarR family transcriptional regulator
LSSLRIDSLRLVWLEAFVQVADSENISEAARELSCDQSTVSRYMKALEKWSGKKLIVPSVVSDPENPGVNVKITTAGDEFYDLAKAMIEKLTSFRTEEARGLELLARMETMIATMRTDLESKHPSQTVLSVQGEIEKQTQRLADLRSEGSVVLLEGYYPIFRRFFANYETVLQRERRKTRKRKKGSAKNIDMSQYRTKRNGTP